MAKANRRSRGVLMLIVGALVVAALVAAFWPRASMVDLGEVTRGAMQVSIEDEGRTRVIEPYTVSTPVAGRLQRVTVDPGDPVVKGQTVVARMLPTNPAVLDVRTREQARAAVTAAQAALRVAQADLNAAMANRDLAESEYARTRRLAGEGIVSEAALDRARQNFRVVEASVDTAEAAIAIREAELANAQSRLIGFDDRGMTGAADDGSDDIPLYAPANGRILRIMQQSETTLPAGAAIMEIGDIDGRLEVVVDLISSDAVQVKPGDPVIIDDWGGPSPLAGRVLRVDPLGVTKYSALGVEEQRVPVTIEITSLPQAHGGLGHGYRVTARIVVWQKNDIVRVPSAALFRDGPGWAVFLERAGRAVQQPVQIGRNNGQVAQVLAGLEPGARVVLFPSAAIRDGSAIAERSVQ